MELGSSSIPITVSWLLAFPLTRPRQRAYVDRIAREYRFMLGGVNFFRNTPNKENQQEATTKWIVAGAFYVKIRHKFIVTVK
jgi:hypothetical protein